MLWRTNWKLAELDMVAEIHNNRVINGINYFDCYSSIHSDKYEISAPLVNNSYLCTEKKLQPKLCFLRGKSHDCFS